MKKLSKKVIALVLAATMVAGFSFTAFASESEDVVISESDKPYISLGADLTADQRDTVLSLFGLTEADLADYDVVTVTNAQEHEYLDAYIPSSTIGTKALSSVVVWEASKGDGINVTTKNISYCTSGMYSNALATAGVTDANVIVAGPTEISGTAALIGAIEAYSVMTDETISTDIIDGAINEIVTTGELEESTGNTDEVEGIIAYLKDELEDIPNMSDEELNEEIEDVADDFDVSLTEDEIAQIRELLRKLQDLDLDWDSISQQANDLFDRLESSGFDLSSLGLGDIDTGSLIQQVREVFNRFVDFFRNLGNRN
ncbi:MAG: DUF1002 domain-containing protein [Lachnospiraceae bacterium]|nr:DUF1002 domain-containing protein [Lachnospiraceae bacterium]